MEQTIKVTASTTTLPNKIVDALQKALNFPKNEVSLHEPSFFGNERKYLQECIDSTFVSSVGKFVDRFEEDLSSLTGSKYTVAVVNGTQALYVALLLAGVKLNDEVLVPTLSFVATANAVSYCGAKPHFLDCEERTLGLDPYALLDYLKSISEVRNGQCYNKKTKNRIHAMVPVHVFGHPCDLDMLLKLAKDFHMVIVEDGAESLGSLYFKKHTGTLGLLGTLSFNGNKTVTTGGGGAILTQKKELAARAKHLITTAKLSHRWDSVHDEIGFNYRMPNLNAALGCAQLEQLQVFIENKQSLYERYCEAFADIEEVKLLSEPEGCRSNYWLQSLCLEEKSSHQRDLILEATNNAGLMTRPVWKLLHTIEPYKNCPHAPLPVAESLESRLINLPSSPGLV